MAIHLEPAATRSNWSIGLDGKREASEARKHTAVAGPALEGLEQVLPDAAQDMAGVLKVVDQVVDEHTEGMEACIADFQATDGNAAGEFRALAR